ncbi:hypothetical protein E2C01_097966 [Portunus trituberculatus]|uniref:Uncharacterized protein n=1 Tax=Portunus trituberculatus TaxID=210409 RepID=A0A5B7KAX9_PORTR|nr:hypothetical protein [Portunus trituberculatus]
MASLTRSTRTVPGQSTSMVSKRPSFTVSSYSFALFRYGSF